MHSTKNMHIHTYQSSESYPEVSIQNKMNNDLLIKVCYNETY